MAWLTIRELSEKMGVSPRTVRRMIQREALPTRLEKGLRQVQWADGSEDNPSAEEGGVDKASLELLCRVFEDLRTLRLQCVREAKLAQSIEPILRELSQEEPPPMFERWKSLFQKIDHYVRILQPLVRNMSLDPKVLLEVYVGMLDVKEKWNYYVESSLDPQDTTGGPRVPKELGSAVAKLRSLRMAGAVN